jgi:hypothetical protein
MPRKKSPKIKQSLKDFVESYDYRTLMGMLNTFQTSEGWEVFKSYIRLKQREMEVAALDLIKHDGHDKMAAHASGYAQALEDLTERMMPGLIDLILGKTAVIENPPADVVVEDHPNELS